MSDDVNNFTVEEAITFLQGLNRPLREADAIFAAALGAECRSVGRLGLRMRLVPWYAGPGGKLYPHWNSVPRYTANLDDSFGMLEWVLRGWTFAVDATAPEAGVDVELFEPGNGLRIKGTAATPEIACLVAILSARQAIADRDMVRGAA